MIDSNNIAALLGYATGYAIIAALAYALILYWWRV